MSYIKTLQKCQIEIKTESLFVQLSVTVISDADVYFFFKDKTNEQSLEQIINYYVNT